MEEKVKIENTGRENNNDNKNDPPLVEVIYKVCFIIFILTLMLTFNISIIPSGSMNPTIPTSSIVVGRVVHSYSPKRFDIVQAYTIQKEYKFENSSKHKIIAKRIIGLGGEKLEIKDGKVYINDSTTPLDEPFLPSEYVPNGNFGPFYIPEGYVFLMGDNRDNSLDSRYTDNPFIKVENIVAIIEFSITPNIHFIH